MLVVQPEIKVKNPLSGDGVYRLIVHMSDGTNHMVHNFDAVVWPTCVIFLCIMVILHVHTAYFFSAHASILCCI